MRSDRRERSDDLLGTEMPARRENRCPESARPGEPPDRAGAGRAQRTGRRRRPAPGSCSSRLAQWCDVRPASTHRRQAMAWFATEPGAPGISEPVEAGARSGCGSIGPTSSTPLGPSGRRRYVVTADPAVADGLADDHVLVVGPAATGPPPPLPRSPFVRRRWRHRSGFPGAMVVRVGADVDDTAGADRPLALRRRRGRRRRRAADRAGRRRGRGHRCGHGRGGRGGRRRPRRR